MIGLSWNCQGLGSVLTSRALHQLNCANRFDLIFLMETKMKRSKVEEIQRSLHMDNLFTVDPSGLSGGLALMWRNSIQVFIEEASKNFIDTAIEVRETKGFWRATFVYGDPDFYSRRLIWQYLAQTNKPIVYPWLCLGDFNDIVSHAEKRGGNQRAGAKIQSFNDFIFDCGFMELDTKGERFTWANNRDEDDYIQEKLDRAIANGKWRLLFEHALVELLPAIGSDHSPLLLNTNPRRSNLRRPFKFDERWLESEECEGVVYDNWGKATNGSEMFRVMRKLMFCKRGLQEWNRSKSYNSKRLINQLTNALSKIREGTRTRFSKEEEESIIKQIDDLWIQEEIYWSQRSRVRWLSWGNQNTAFFHATTVQRRQRNTLTKLKNEEDIWFDRGNGMENLIFNHFKDIFKSNGERFFQPVLDAIPTRVSESMNQELLRPITRDEVKSAAFQLGARKSPGPDGFSDFRSLT